MDKHLVFIRSIVCIACFFTLLWGCEKQEEPPQKAREITKKIIIAEPAAPKSQPPEKMAVEKPAPIEETAAATPESGPQSPKQPVAATPKNVVAPMPHTPQTVEKPDAAKSVFTQTAKMPTPETPPQVPIQRVDTAHKTIVASVSSTSPQIETPEISGLYNPVGKLDPFEPLFRRKETASLAAEKKKSKRRTPLTPLENLDLSQLKLVGIVSAPSGNMALIQETSGKGYVVKNGTYIGTHSGKITQILKDRIVLEEEVENIYGNIVVQKKEINLRLPGEE